jgi:hypothetical protein
VHKDLKVLSVHKVLQVFKGLSVLKGVKVFREHLEHKGLQDFKDL